MSRVKKTKFNPDGSNEYDYEGDIEDQKKVLDFATAHFGRKIEGCFMIAWSRDGTGIVVVNASEEDMKQHFKKAVMSL